MYADVADIHVPKIHVINQLYISLCWGWGEAAAFISLVYVKLFILPLNTVFHIFIHVQAVCVCDNYYHVSACSHSNCVCMEHLCR